MINLLGFYSGLKPFQKDLTVQVINDLATDGNQEYIDSLKKELGKLKTYIEERQRFREFLTQRQNDIKELIRIIEFSKDPGDDLVLFLTILKMRLVFLQESIAKAIPQA